MSNEIKNLQKQYKYTKIQSYDIYKNDLNEFEYDSNDSPKAYYMNEYFDKDLSIDDNDTINTINNNKVNNYSISLKIQSLINEPLPNDLLSKYSSIISAINYIKLSNPYNSYDLDLFIKKRIVDIDLFIKQNNIQSIAVLKNQDFNFLLSFISTSFNYDWFKDSSFFCDLSNIDLINYKSLIFKDLSKDNNFSDHSIIPQYESSNSLTLDTIINHYQIENLNDFLHFKNLDKKTIIEISKLIYEDKNINTTNKISIISKLDKDYSMNSYLFKLFFVHLYKNSPSNYNFEFFSNFESFTDYIYKTHNLSFNTVNGINSFIQELQHKPSKKDDPFIGYNLYTSLALSHLSILLFDEKENNALMNFYNFSTTYVHENIDSNLKLKNSEHSEIFYLFSRNNHISFQYIQNVINHLFYLGENKHNASSTPLETSTFIKLFSESFPDFIPFKMIKDLKDPILFNKIVNSLISHLNTFNNDSLKDNIFKSLYNSTLALIILTPEINLNNNIINFLMVKENKFFIHLNDSDKLAINKKLLNSYFNNFIQDNKFNYDSFLSDLISKINHCDNYFNYNILQSILNKFDKFNHDGVIFSNLNNNFSSIFEKILFEFNNSDANFNKIFEPLKQQLMQQLIQIVDNKTHKKFSAVKFNNPIILSNKKEINYLYQTYSFSLQKISLIKNKSSIQHKYSCSITDNNFSINHSSTTQNVISFVDLKQLQNLSQQINNFNLTHPKFNDIKQQTQDLIQVIQDFKSLMVEHHSLFKDEHISKFNNLVNSLTDNVQLYINSITKIINISSSNLSILSSFPNNSQSLLTKFDNQLIENFNLVANEFKEFDLIIHSSFEENIKDLRISNKILKQSM